jgi:hypothetical protein
MASVPLVASLLHRVFVLPNARMMARVDLLERLEDKLYTLRQTQGARVAALWNPKPARTARMRENVV